MAGPPPASADAARQRPLAAFAFRALMALLALAPLPLGSNRPWAWSLIGLVVGLLLVAWGLAALRRRAPAGLSWRRHGVLSVCFLALTAWFLLQASGLTPAAWDDAMWREAAIALGRPLDGAISPDPAASGDGIVRLLAYAGVFWLAAQYGREPDRARTVLRVIAAAAFAYAAYGLVVFLSGNETILWYRKWTYGGDLTSTFVNRNSYADYAGLGLLTALALSWEAARGGMADGLGSRVGVRHFLDSLPFSFFVLVLAGAAIATALVLSHSRGGLAATGLGVVVLLAALAAGRRTRKRTVVAAAAVILLAGLAVLEVSGEGTLRRIVAQADEGTGREAIHGLVRRAIADAPIAGRGLDSFPQIYFRYRDLAIPWDSPRYDRAHSPYLELALEAGLVAFGVFMAMLAALTVILLRGVTGRRRDAVYPCLGVAATALIGVHSTLDFGVQIPAVAVTFAALLGVAYAQSWRTRGGSGGAALSAGAASDRPDRSGATGPARRPVRRAPIRARSAAAPAAPGRRGRFGRRPAPDRR